MKVKLFTTLAGPELNLQPGIHDINASLAADLVSKQFADYLESLECVADKPMAAVEIADKPSGRKRLKK